MFANSHRHNIIIHPSGRCATFVFEFKTVVRIVPDFLFAVGKIFQVFVPPLNGVAQFRVLLAEYFSSCSVPAETVFFPVISLIVAAISEFLVVRVVRFVPNSSKTAFSFVAAAMRLSKYLLRDASTIG